MSELRIRGGTEDNSKIIFLTIIFSIKTYVVTINETVMIVGHKMCIYEKIQLIISKLSLLPLLIWSTECALNKN